jgi:hypothetical protein
MIIISIILLAVVAYAVYFAVDDRLKDRKHIILAEAGDKDSITGDECSDVTESDVAFSKKDYIPFKVRNGCMSYVGINDGDICFAKKIHNLSRNNISTLIKSGDVLLLKINDGGTIKHKIRMVDKVLTADDIETFYFIKKGETIYKHKSSSNHQMNQVLGIVEYKKAS